ncbi:MAG TPA: hypothetical protein VHT97_00905 [Acidimicrobiales bacterium]|nr:hypothetical protein [Acidimicrobiales bacterium]
MLVATVMAFVAMLGVGGFALALPASAQVGSGVGSCTVVTGTQDVGTVSVGQQFVLQVSPTCLFDVGAPLTVTVNGVSVVGKVANVNGQVLITITATSTTQLSVDDPTITPAVCGVNTVTVTGPSSVAVGGVATQTATFTLNCATTVTTTVTPAVASTGGPATPITGRLSLTGADTVRFVAIALALMAVGSMAVVASRRRRAAAN